jgi:hypothetical protein
MPLSGMPLAEGSGTTRLGEDGKEDERE